MDLAAIRRRHIKWSISQHPTNISIHRVGKVRSGGGYEETDKTLPPITVRIFMDRNIIASIDSKTVGTKQTDAIFSLLADELADIKADVSTTDSFTAFGQLFRIADVRPQVISGQIVGYQAALERVG